MRNLFYTSIYIIYLLPISYPLFAAGVDNPLVTDQEVSVVERSTTLDEDEEETDPIDEKVNGKNILLGSLGTTAAIAAMVALTPRVYPDTYEIREREIKEFFGKTGVQYTENNLFSQECQPLARLEGGKNNYDRDLTQRYGSYIQRHYTAPYFIRWLYEYDNKIGYGLFADADMKQGDYLMEFTGVVKKCTATEPCESNKICDQANKSWSWSYLWGDSAFPDSTCLDSSTHGNAARFLNHSDDPNVKVEKVFHQGSWHIVYILTQDVKQGKQFFGNYGEGYFRRKPKIELVR